MANQIQIVRHAGHKVTSSDTMVKTGVFILKNVIHFSSQTIEGTLAALFQQHDHGIAHGQPCELNSKHGAQDRKQQIGILRGDDFVDELL